MTRTVRPAQSVVYCHTKMLALTSPAAAPAAFAPADSYSYADIQLSNRSTVVLVDVLLIQMSICCSCRRAECNV